MNRSTVFWVLLFVSIVLIFSGSTLGIIIDNDSIEKTHAEKLANQLKEEAAKLEEEAEKEKAIPKSVTGLLVGFDASKGLTDVLMVGHLDTEKNEVDVVSVPRDLVIDFTDDKFKHIKENNPNNYVSYCKLNEVYNASGADERALQDVEEIVSIITGLKIDYMACIDVSGFKDLIDVIGGVEFDVPERMYYSDPAQDLLIDLQPGLQLLDGDKTMQLARYRHYKMGDLQRIQVQQSVMVAIFDKVMAIDDFSKVKQLATKGYSMFEADFGLFTALDYAQYFFDLQFNDILSTEHMVTIPSYGEQRDGIWYQTWDIDEAHQIVDTIIKD